MYLFNNNILAIFVAKMLDHNIEASVYAKGGEIFVLDMGSLSV